MKPILLYSIICLTSICQAQDLIITSTLLRDGKSNFRFKERYTEWFTSNTIKYEYDSTLNQYVSNQIRINKTKAIFLPDTIRVKKRIRIKKQLTVLTDSVAQAIIFLIQDTTKNSDGTSLSMRTSHRYEHIYISYIQEQDTISFHIFSPEYMNSSWENRKHPYHRTNTNFDRLLYMIMPEEFLLRDYIEKRL